MLALICGFTVKSHIEKTKYTQNTEYLLTGKTDYTHRHLHLELILVELKEDVWEGPLQQGGGPQNQDQLEIPGEGALK